MRNDGIKDVDGNREKYIDGIEKNRNSKVLVDDHVKMPNFHIHFTIPLKRQVYLSACKS